MTDFLQGFQDAQRQMVAAAERGMGKAVLACMHDVIMDMPTAPLDEGTLRGSGTCFVGPKLVAVTPPQGGHPTPATSLEFSGPDGVIVGTVGFNTDYAARLHEHPEFNFTEPGSGGKFLENKLNANRDKYVGIVAAEMRGMTGA